MSSFGLLGVVCLFLVAIVGLHPVTADGPTLVLLDHLSTKETHSIFFNSLQGKDAGPKCADKQF